MAAQAESARGALGVPGPGPPKASPLARPPEADERLAQGQDRYRLLAENGSDVVYLTDERGTIAWVSPSVRRVLGFDPESLIGTRALDLVDPRDTAAVQAKRSEVHGGGTVVEVLTRFLSSHGQPLWMSVIATPLRSDSGEVSGAVVALRDVDQLVRSREAAEAARQRLQATLDAMLDPHVHLDALRDESATIIDFVYSEANPAACAYNGLAREELIGARLLVLLPGHVGTGMFARFCDVVETGRPLSLDAFAYPVEVRGGELRHADVRGVKVGDGLSYTWRDVTTQVQDRTRLADSERRYRLLVDNTSDVVVLADRERRLVWVSPSVRPALGWTPEELVGSSFIDLVHPDDRVRLTAAVDGAAGHALEARTRYRIRCADDSYRWVSSAGREALDEQGVSVGRVVALRDIDAQVAAEQRLAASERQFRLLAENASDIVWHIATDGRVLWVSESVRAILGWRPEDLVGTIGVELAHPEDLDRVRAARDAVIAGGAIDDEFRFSCADGSWRWVEVSERALPDTLGSGRVVAMRDIQAAVEARTELEHVIGHDGLTGLGNRLRIQQRIAELLDRAGDRTTRLAVLCVGVDALGAINAAFTHNAGDLVLATLARRIRAVVSNDDLLARGTGAEFLVVVPDLPDIASSALIAERLRTSAKDPVTLPGREIRATVSIGIAGDGVGADADRLIRDATLAMRRAKEDGRDRVRFFDPHLAEVAEQTLQLIGEVMDGLDRREFSAWFQPIIHLAGGHTAGYEALVRWEHPDGRVITPAEYLSHLESTPLIVDLDLTVLRHAVEVLATLPSHQFVSVNVSARTLALGDYAAKVSATLADARVEPTRLHLELTETSLLGVSAAVRGAISAIAESGVRWYVDDFGTGFSSISHLRDLPISGLKLDLSFTAGIQRGDSTSIKLAQALAGMAQGLGLDTVAEGVETALQATILASQGWRNGQGWLYGRAVPADQLTRG